MRKLLAEREGKEVPKRMAFAAYIDITRLLCFGNRYWR
jgi:hypothetical protein